tara:strand:+ start:151 stop:372 length:222 start_codon:yes stop_codon:yes gene_type:complete
MSSSETPQELGAIDWIDYRFRDLNEDDLFWFEKNPNGNENPAFRKVGEGKALDLRSQIVIDVDGGLLVHQKEW